MVRFDELGNLNDEQFLRTVGLSRECFVILVEKISIQLDKENKENPIKKRGIKGLFLLEDKVLVTLYYSAPFV